MGDRSALKDAARLVHPPADDEPSTRAGQEARNLRRVFLLWRRAAEESLSAEDLGVSRRQLKHLRDAHKLVGLQLPCAGALSIRRGSLTPKPVSPSLASRRSWTRLRRPSSQPSDCIG
jgi:hypothetical protein